ncbi:MAG TPA: hypothetical protein PKC28_09680 [Bdellovibrionales bacterium]|nr:hypothetical protein [Bdellovibrionales bacterium]
MKKLVLLALCLPFTARAYFQMDFMKDKASARASSRWTLADWLTQKNKMSLADQWLAMNRSVNLFDVNLSGGHNKYKVKTTDPLGNQVTVDNESMSYGADMYISFVNLFGEYEKTKDDQESYGGGLGLRLLGSSTQTTSLVVRYGWRRLRDLGSQEDWENQFAEGELELYLIRAFGLTGKYRHYFPRNSNKGTRLAGHRVSAGAFFEFAVFRLFGNYYEEPTELGAPADRTTQKRAGVEGGLSLMF